MFSPQDPDKSQDTSRRPSPSSDLLHDPTLLDVTLKTEPQADATVAEVQTVLDIVKQNRPTLFGLLNELGDRTVKEHAANLFSLGSGTSEVFADLFSARAIAELAVPEADREQVREAIRSQLLECPTINLSGHQASLTYPGAFQSYYVAALGAREQGLSFSLSLAGSVVPLCNSDFPAGLVLRGVEVPVITGKAQKGLVYGAEPFSAEQWKGGDATVGDKSVSYDGLVETAVLRIGAQLVMARLPEDILEHVSEKRRRDLVPRIGEIVVREGAAPEFENQLVGKKAFNLSPQHAEMILNAISATKPLLTQIRQETQRIVDCMPPSFYEADSLSTQITRLNHALWNEAFKGTGTPQQISLALESLIPDLIAEAVVSHNDVARLLFEPVIRDEYVAAMKGIQGGWDIRGTGDDRQLIGTQLFWGRNPDSGKLVGLELVDGVLVGGGIEVPYDVASIQKALQNQLIAPSVATSMTLLNFHGVRCLGGYNQVDYLTAMMNGAQRVCAQHGLDVGAARFAVAESKSFVYGPALALERGIDERLHPASLDTMLRSPAQTFAQLEQNGSVSLRDATIIGLIPELKSILPSSIPAAERQAVIDSLPLARIATRVGFAVPPQTVPARRQASHLARLADKSSYGEQTILRYIRERVGNTALVHAPELAQLIGLPNLHLKNDGLNPTGTHKDRIAMAQVLDAQRQGQTAVAGATCGNYGVSLARAANLGSTADQTAVGCVLHIPESFHCERISEMERWGAQIIRSPGTYEDAVELSREYARQHGLYDANPGTERNTVIQSMAYSTIALELYAQLGEMPSAVAVPVSNGTTLVGIYEGFKDLIVELERIGVVASMPALIAVSSKDLNPIVRSLRENLAVYTPYSSTHIDNRETAINEPLINWNSLDGAKTFDAVKESGGWAKWVTDQELEAMSRLLKKVHGIVPIPAAVASICGLESSAADFSSESGPIVAVLTGVQPWSPDADE